MTSEKIECDEIMLLKALLCDTGLAGFTFNTSFSLRFERNNAASFLGDELPWCVELRLDAEWGFGDIESWQKRVACEGPSGSPSPDEPIQAFELARLRWTDGANISDVAFDGRVLRIFFDNQTQLFVDSQESDSYWDIIEYGVPENDAKWNVVCEGSVLSVNFPVKTAQPKED